MVSFLLGIKWRIIFFIDILINIKFYGVKVRNFGLIFFSVHLCALFYFVSDQNYKKTSQAFKESFTEMKPDTALSYTQTAAGTYTPQGNQAQTSYYQSPNSPTTPQLSSNVPATYNYQTGSNVGQGYTSNYYNGYHPSPTREQTGYQRSQGFKRPSRPNIPTYTRPGAAVSPYVPKQPLYAKGASRGGIPARVYQPSTTIPRTYAYLPTPASSYRVPQSNTGYPKSYTTQRPFMPAYKPPWSSQNQVGYARTQTPSIPRGPSYNIKYPHNTRSYNGYDTIRNQQPNGYLPGAIPTGSGTGSGIGPTGSYVSQTGSASQETGFVRNGIYSPVTTNTMPYQEGPTNAKGNRYSTTPAGQYQSIIPSSGQQSGQYKPLPNQYLSRIKSFVSQNNYQTSNQNELLRNDVTSQMTSLSDVISTPYTSDLQSPTQNAFQRNNVYSTNKNNYWGNDGYNPTAYAEANNVNSLGTPVTRQYTSPYDTRSMAPRYGTNYAYPVGSATYSNMVRGNIPRPKSPKAKQGSRRAHVTKQEQMQNMRTMQGLIYGPSRDKNKPSRVNKLDENGQFPSDMKKYQNLAQMNARKSNAQAHGAGISSSSYTGVKQPAYTLNGNRWSTRTQTPTGWNSGAVGKTGSYDSWSAGLQAQKPENLWSSGPVLKVHEVVKYNNDAPTLTSQPTTTNTGNKATTKGIDMDKVVNKAFNDFLTMQILRKRKRKKRENELTQTLQQNKRTRERNTEPDHASTDRNTHR